MVGLFAFLISCRTQVEACASNGATYLHALVRDVRMLSPKTQTNLKNAQSYFEKHLAVGDYYSQAEEVIGEWIGQGAIALGLPTNVARDDFLRLCENRHPQTGKRLTVRQKDTRKTDDGGEAANRRVFFDFTFSPPKSVSVAALVGDDQRIVAAHRAAVKIAVQELETFAATRVRIAGTNSDRSTGNIVAALFEHETSRALDPHLHTHCIVFNATHDSGENRWKALQNFQMLVAQKYVENAYYHELARALHRCGYTVENAARGDFRITEISPEVCSRFSKRHRQINEQTKSFLEEHPGKAGGSIKSIREHIAHKERGHKQHDLPTNELRARWKREMSGDKLELSAGDIEERLPLANASDAVDWAEEHLFDRHSVVHEHDLWRYALESARGCGVMLAEIKRETADRPYIRDTPGKLTRRDVLMREWEIVQLSKEGAATHLPFSHQAPEAAEGLAEDQILAFQHILGSRGLVTLFRGGAGTGKSYVLRRVQEALHRAGCPTQVLAPQRQQVFDLTRDGLVDAQTVTQFLNTCSLAKGSVVIVDEAGQLGARQLLNLLKLVQASGARIILSGDTRQHGPVEASDALRAIERHSGLKSAELNEIRRQDPARAEDQAERANISEYRSAVKAASEGSLEDSFNRLEQLGAIIEASPKHLRNELANSYVKLARTNRSAIVVSQTWDEIDEVNIKIRQSLREHGLVAGAEHKVVSLRQIDLTKAQKNDQRYYPEDHVIVFNQNAGRCRRGDLGKLRGITKRGVVIDTGHSLHVLKPAQLDAINICRRDELKLCSGDRLQLKANARTSAGASLANGEIVTISKIKASGDILLSDGRTLPASYRQFVPGYAVTSYGSQGKTVDHVLLVDSGSRAATNAQQWYVSISRGRKSVRIFTPDKSDLRKNIIRSGDRPLALDLNASKRRELAAIQQGKLHLLKRGRSLARAICLMFARKIQGVKTRQKASPHEHQTIAP